MEKGYFRKTLRRGMSALKVYFSAAAAYLLGLTALKLIECLAQTAEGTETGSLIAAALTYNLIVASWEILAGMPFFLLFRKISRKAADILTLFFFSLLLLAELGLTLYASHNGYLLDCELWLRPFAETTAAIRGATGLLLPLLLLVLLPAAVWVVALLFRKCLPGALKAVLPLALVFFLLSVLLHRENLLAEEGYTYTVNKTEFLASNTFRYLRNARFQPDEAAGETLPYREELIRDFLAFHPDWTVEDPAYPLERVDRTPDVLSPFFGESGGKPDVLLFVVESLGDECIANGYTPFLDSLAHQGLYWKNCLSTVERSFGAVPALSASVGGPKGFQFGRMPDFNSLISIFNRNGYRTNAFYAGYFAFDCMEEYLRAQDIGWLSPFWQEWKETDDKHAGNFWGFHDHVMLQKTLEELRTRTAQPQFSIITTLSMHEDLELQDGALQQKYLEQSRRNPHDGEFRKTARMAAACYTDDALRKFMAQYRSLPRYANTIFIFTGDHASGLAQGSCLNTFHHVPLIIWSPLLERHGTFRSVVTHLDLEPSLCRLLAGKYGLEMPATLHAWGEGLDTSSVFRAERDMLIVSYNREMREMLSGPYYYRMQCGQQKEQLCRLDSLLGFTPVDDSALLQQCRHKLECWRYVFSYAYFNNRTTKHPLRKPLQYRYITTYRRKGEVRYVSPMEPPEKAGRKAFSLFEELSLPHLQGYGKVRLTLTADVTVVDSLWQDKYPSVVLDFRGEEDVLEKDYVTKFIPAEVLRRDSTYPMEVTRTYPLSAKGNNLFRATLRSPEKEKYWEPGKRMTLKNVALKVEYAP